MTAHVSAARLEQSEQKKPSVRLNPALINPYIIDTAL